MLSIPSFQHLLISEMASICSTSETFDIAFRFLSTSASLAGILMLIRCVASEVFLEKLRSYFLSFFDYLFSFFPYLCIRLSTNLTFVIDEFDEFDEFEGKSRNEFYDAANLYLATKIGLKTKRFKLSKTKKKTNFSISIEKAGEIDDIFEEIQLKWRYKCDRTKTHPRESFTDEKFFELSFHKKFKDKVVTVYLPHVLASAEEIKEKSKVVEMYSCDPDNFTLVINEFSGGSRNEVYDAADLYLPTKIGLSKTERRENFAISVENGKEIVDVFEGIQLKWRYGCKRIKTHENFREEKFLELSFHNKFKDKVVAVYLPHVLASAEEIKEKTNVVKIYSCDRYNRHWSSTIVEHPATFDTVAMDPELRKMIIDDLERFVRRREFYKKVGKAWKRGYLLYGPPGTGKSSLIAAMANYLKFDIYDLDLASIYSNSDLRNFLLSTTSRSILVIEDIDCSIQVQDRKNQLESDNSNARLTLSGILNLIEGMWSSCGDERIIVFTTNHKDRLDPALLRPGRMDIHINLSYCTVNAFRFLASNYLDISNRDHPLLGEIESLIESAEVTPAEVAGELMRSEDADLALQGLVDFIKHKRSKCDKIEEEVAEIEEANSFKSDNEEKEITGGSGSQHEVGEEREGQRID